MVMLDTTTAPQNSDPATAFVVIAQSPGTPFYLDAAALDYWVADEGDELVRCLPSPGDACPGSALADLVYGALSAGVLVGDPRLELNVHNDGAGYLVRLNNVAGRQIPVGLTRGRHELRWPANDLTPNESARHYLQEVCCIVNTLLADLQADAT